MPAAVLPAVSMLRTDSVPAPAASVTPIADHVPAPAVASMLIYVLMAAVICWRPSGLFPARG